MNTVLRRDEIDFAGFPGKTRKRDCNLETGSNCLFFSLLFRFEVAFQTICTVGIQYATVEISTTNVTFVSCANMPPTWLPVPRDSFVPFTMYVSSGCLFCSVFVSACVKASISCSREHVRWISWGWKVASKKGVERFFPFLRFLCYSTIQTVEQR